MMDRAISKKTVLAGIIIVFAGAGPVSGIRDYTAGSLYSFNWQQWPAFHHDPQHTGHTNSPAPDANDVLWTYTTFDDVESSPAVAYGRVYVGSSDNRVYCLDAETGEFIWDYTTGGDVLSSPAIADSKVFVGSWDRKVYCLDAGTGDFIWDYTTGSIVRSSPPVVDGKVYIGSVDGKIYCLDAETGDRIWEQSTGGNVASSPAVASGKVYVGSYDNKVHCLDAETGDFIWEYETGGDVYSSPAVFGGKVYIGSWDNNVYCLDAETGEFIWDYATGGDIYSSPAVFDEKVYVGSRDGNVYCLDAETGDLLWNYSTPTYVDSSPAVADGKVYVGSSWWTFHCLDAETGDFIWEHTMGDGVTSSPAVARGKVYVGSEDGKIYCFGSYDNDVGSVSINWPFGTIQPGSYTVDATVENFGVRDQMDVPVSCSIYRIDLLTYFEDFEMDNGDFAGTHDWEWGHPTTGPNGGHSGENVWGTVLDGEYTIGPLLSTLVSPPIILGNDARLSFWHYYATAYFYDGGNVKISTDGGTSWQLVMPEDGYDRDLFTGYNNPIGGEEAFTGYSGGWAFEEFDLSAYAGYSIMLRFDFGAGEVTEGIGWYLDDIIVDYVAEVELVYSSETVGSIPSYGTVDVEFSPEWGVADPGYYGVKVITMLPDDRNPFNDSNAQTVIVAVGNDAGAVSVNQPTGHQVPGDHAINVTVKNFGYLDQNTLPVSCTVYDKNGDLVYAADTTAAVPALEEMHVGFSPAWYVLTPGPYQINATTLLPRDENPENDMTSSLVWIHQPPDAPDQPAGPTEVETGEPVWYSTGAIDPDEHWVRYRFDWDAEGYHEYSDWTGLGPSDHADSLSHSWYSPGMHVAKAQAQDEYDALSEWSDGLAVDVIGEEIDLWSMFRHDLRHTGGANSRSPETDYFLWHSRLRDDVRSSAAIVDGRIYTGSSYDRVYCLDAETGDKLWFYTTAGPVESSPSVVNGRVYAGSEDGRVYCLDAKTGDFIWSYTTGDEVHSSPAVAYGFVYVGSNDNTLYCLDAETGDSVWSYTTGGCVQSSPAVAYDKVYTGSDDGNIYCLDAETGSVIWSYTTGGKVYSSPVVADGRIYIGSDDNALYCLDAETGDFVWEYVTGDDIRSSPAFADDKIIVGSYDYKVYCLDAESGDLIWDFTTGYIVHSSPAVSRGKVCICSLDNKVYCLDAETGDFIWHYATAGDIYSSPAIAYGRVYVGSDDNYMYCLGSPDNDIGCISVNSPSGGIQPGSHTITATVKNFGSSDQNDVPVYCSIFEIDWTAYFEDFEESDGNYVPSNPRHAWEWGYDYIVPDSGHSGDNVWGTWLNNPYSDDVHWTLTSPPFVIGNNTTLSFNHWYHTEYESDGGNVKISTDNGNSWWLIVPENGYDTVLGSGNTLGNEPAFSGDSNVWRLEEFDLSEYAMKVILLKFDFGSDDFSWWSYPGWYIDDVAIDSTVAVTGLVYSSETVVSVPSYATADVEFSPAWDVSEPGSYGIYVTTGLTGDRDHSNDYSLHAVTVTAGKDAASVVPDTDGSDGHPAGFSGKRRNTALTTGAVSTESAAEMLSEYGKITTEPDGTVHFVWDDEPGHDSAGGDSDSIHDRERHISHARVPRGGEIIVPDDYPTIQDAIDNATDGDVIFVRSGTYEEKIDVNKGLSVIGEGRNTTIIDGGGGYGDAVELLADSVLISGFTIRNSGWHTPGIMVRSNHNTISANGLIDNERGIVIDESYGNSLYDNIVKNNDKDGIVLVNSYNNDVSENLVLYNGWSGIVIDDYSAGNTIQRNHVSLHSCYDDGIALSDYAHDNLIAENDVIDNCYGINLCYSSNNTIVGNNVTRSNWGFYLYLESNGNSIYHNNLFDNIMNARDRCDNAWDNGYPSGGNYWHDFTGSDDYSGPDQDITGPDGIGDVPYAFPDGAEDGYPLMNPLDASLVHIIDDSDPQFHILTGQWNAAEYSSAYNGEARFTEAGSGNRMAAWKVDTIVDPGIYDVYVWKFEHDFMEQMGTNVHYAVGHRNGISGWIVVDQSTPGYEWIYLGTFEFDDSFTQGVMINDNADGYVIADAIKLVLVGSTK